MTRITIIAIASLLLIDVFGAFAWFFSGQALPESGYYVGKITVEVLKFLLKV